MHSHFTMSVRFCSIFNNAGYVGGKLEARRHGPDSKLQRAHKAVRALTCRAVLELDYTDCHVSQAIQGTGKEFSHLQSDRYDSP